MVKSPNPIDANPQPQASVVEVASEIVSPNLAEKCRIRGDGGSSPSPLGRPALVLQFPKSLGDNRSSSIKAASSQGSRRSMARRSGQAGAVVVKGGSYHGRYWAEAYL